jgi:hypothetical protein
MPADVCHGIGCDQPLAPQKGRGRRRKWCSERCRKVTLYSGECRDCGARINTSGDVARRSERCNSCANQHKIDQSRRWILDSVAEWVELFGTPPSAVDWKRRVRTSYAHGGATTPEPRPSPSPRRPHDPRTPPPRAKPSSGLEPETPSLPWGCNHPGTPPNPPRRANRRVARGGRGGRRERQRVRTPYARGWPMSAPDHQAAR